MTWRNQGRKEAPFLSWINIKRERRTDSQALQIQGVSLPHSVSAFPGNAPYSSLPSSQPWLIDILSKQALTPLHGFLLWRLILTFDTTSTSQPHFWSPCTSLSFAHKYSRGPSCPLSSVSLFLIATLSSSSLPLLALHHLQPSEMLTGT